MTDDSPLLITCVGVDHDLDLLPHFLDHYLALGIAPDRMRPILNALDGGSDGLAQAKEILRSRGVERAIEWIAPYTSGSMWEKRREVQKAEAEPSDWVLSADVDEYHEYPERLPAFLERCGQMGVDCVQGVFIDRVAEGGKLASVARTPALHEQFPVEADVIWTIGGEGSGHNRRGSVKVMAIRGHVLPSRGGHHPVKEQSPSFLYNHPLGEFPEVEDPSFRFSVPTRVHHYHWTASLPERLRIRLATPGVSRAGAYYGQKQLDHFEQHGGLDMSRIPVRSSGSDEDWQDALHRIRRKGAQRKAAEPFLAPLRAVKKRIMG
ncbi:hypothetical protein HK107_11025 [Parvularcula sp. ZS-1/3]|uniref:Uncharacterized protein n=1 Tax=Parvularcula mediterranea TaxID=2732508 RepID=A0A7Y3W5K4_9PROT|nr:hypothetical protein [Parvularcula mediterranea]NNU16850.1 hypothetical protein [Parvularcula mediterranea]